MLDDQKLQLIGQSLIDVATIVHPAGQTGAIAAVITALLQLRAQLAAISADELTGAWAMVSEEYQRQSDIFGLLIAQELTRLDAMEKPADG